MNSVCDKEQDNIYINSVTFIKSQEDSISSNVKLTQEPFGQDQEPNQDPDLNQGEDFF